MLTFTRFHFSNQAFPRLAQLQWNHQPATKLNGVRPLIIGHRGSGCETTSGEGLIGNTATAIERGINAGADWIEVDIRVSGDGHLVVFHDDAIDLKTTGEGMVSSLSLDQLHAVEILTNPPERILSWDEAFEIFHSDERKWVLDVKSKGIHEKVLQWLDHKVAKGELLKDQVIIFGTYEILTGYKGCGYALGYTAIWKNIGNQFRVLFNPSEIIKRCQILECDHLVVPIIFANQALVDRAVSNGLNVWVYGSDDRRDLEHGAGRGIGGFIVDRPGVAMDLFGKKGDQNPAEMTIGPKS